ncbi:uncharacterized protein LOC113312685 [Papaver somniferum]|uniref:uncharacterized protein LOC113312685 n=1 Tax=Papaver somniferum TaxID=3469 RepID=UPI000E6F7E5B|nr:uncharacterized protein LOC113312685 [Papaver somniferum]
MASDHCSILLTTARNESKVFKPFRFNRAWFRDATCKDLIESSWKKCGMGSPAFRHSKALTVTKEELRKWNYNVFGNISTQINKLETTLHNLLYTNHAPNSAVVVEVQSKLKHRYDIKEDFWRQRGKEEAFKFGERNTAYFHNKTNFRRKTTQIDTIQNDMGIWLTDRADIAANLKSHFSKMSRTTMPPNPSTYLDYIMPCISNEENNMLTGIPTHEEVKNVIFSMQPWTTPGLDGFPPGFYQEMWSIVGEDTVRMVQSFFRSKHMLKQINHNFVSLIPKVNNPKSAADFRPISLCNVAYKIISKLLASRLKGLLDRIITPYQSAFLSGRLITNTIVIDHELIDSMKHCKAENGWMAIKLDMSKAFDIIEWSFLLDVLSRLGFCDDFCSMINNAILQLALLYYDCLLFTKANSKEARNLSTIIDQFSLYSGQAVNFSKSGISFSSKVPNQQNKMESSSSLIDNNYGRLADWKAHFLNQPERTILIQSVLGTLATHRMVVFQMPKKLTDKLDTIHMRFWWNKKEGKKGMFFKKWKEVALAKELGELGIKQSSIMN